MTKLHTSHASEVKRERRKSLFLREINSIISDLAEREKIVADMYVSSVDISPNSGICYVFFSAYTEPGQEIFDRVLDVLKLYKVSIRQAFAQRVNTRYAPELIFCYDKAKEKERRINDLLIKIQEENREKEEESNEE